MIETRADGRIFVRVELEGAGIRTTFEGDPPDAAARLLTHLVGLQSELFREGLARLVPVDLAQLSRHGNLTIEEVRAVLASAVIVFADEALDARRLRSPRHVGTDGIERSGEAITETILILIALEPRVGEGSLYERLKERKIDLSLSQIRAYRERLNLNPSAGDWLEDAIHQLAPCTWLRKPLRARLDRERARAASSASQATPLSSGRATTRRHAPRAGWSDVTAVGPDVSPPPGYRRIHRPLFEHQRQAIDALDQWFSGDVNGAIVCLPTGAGKTKTAVSFVLTRLLTRRPHHRCLWLAHREELIDQAFGAFVENAHEAPSHFTVGRWTSARKDRDRADVVVASLPTLTYRDSKNLSGFRSVQGDFDLVILDECHHSVAYTWRTLLAKLRERVPAPRVLGLSATPTRSDAGEAPWVTRLVGPVVAEANIHELIKRGILAKPIISLVDTKRTFEATAAERADFERLADIPASLVERIADDPERNKTILDTYLSRKRDGGAGWGQTLLFAVNTNHGRTLHDMLRAKGQRAAQVYAETSSVERARIVQEFRERKIEIVINCGIFTEGTDLPCVETVFLTRPTKSRILFAQMVGRGLRGVATGGSESCCVVAFSDEVLGLLQGHMATSFKDEREAREALGLEELPEPKAHVEPPQEADADAAVELDRAREALRSLFQAHGLCPVGVEALPLLGWWEASDGRERRYLPCFRESERREIDGWVAEICGAEGGHFTLPTLPAEAFVAFADVARRVGGRVIWHDVPESFGEADVGEIADSLNSTAALDAAPLETVTEAPPTGADAEPQEAVDPPWWTFAETGGESPVVRASHRHAGVFWADHGVLAAGATDEDLIESFLRLATRQLPPDVDAAEVGRFLREAIATGEFATLPARPPPATLDEIFAFLLTRPKSEWRSIATKLVRGEMSPAGNEDLLLRRLLERALHSKKRAA